MQTCQSGISRGLYTNHGVSVEKGRSGYQCDHFCPLKVGVDIFKAKAGDNWYNRLIWGDNKYIMSSLLEELVGKVHLIYIDPPFAAGADFSVKIEVGDVEWTKRPSSIEDKAYRDTWGKGRTKTVQGSGFADCYEL